ncbi:zinc-binding dehydrogenase [Streptomyces albidoflavus]
MSKMLAGRLLLDTLRFAVEEVPVPVPGPGEVLVAVRGAGVSLSDLHLINGDLAPFHPTAAVRKSRTLTLGHEVAGVIHSVGPGVQGSWAEGRRVALQARQPCGECGGCLRRLGACRRPLTRGLDHDGGWAEYTLAREEALVPIPDELPSDQAAIIPGAAGTAYAAVKETGAVRPGQAVGVWGIGGLGAHGVQTARLAGAAPVIAVDPLPAARKRALALGAHAALDPAARDFIQELESATRGRGVEVAFDFAGEAAARRQAVGALSSGGVLVLVGFTPKPFTLKDGVDFCLQGQQIRGHYGSRPEHMEELIDLASAGLLDLSESVSAQVPLREAADALTRLEQKIDDPVRLVLTP